MLRTGCGRAEVLRQWRSASQRRRGHGGVSVAPHGLAGCLSVPERQPGASTLPQLASYIRNACARTARWSLAWLLTSSAHLSLSESQLRIRNWCWLQVGSHPAGDQHSLWNGCQPCGHHNLSGPDRQDLQSGGWCAPAHCCSAQHSTLVRRHRSAAAAAVVQGVPIMGEDVCMPVLPCVPKA